MFKKRKDILGDENSQDIAQASAEQENVQVQEELSVRETENESAELTENESAQTEEQRLSRRERKALKKEMKNEKRERKKADKASGRRGLRRKLSLSIFLYLFDTLINSLYNQLIKGFFGRIFTAYSKEQECFENSFAAKYVRGLDKFENWAQRSRKKFARAFESSFLLGKMGDLFKIIVSLPLKFYGNLLLSFGFYSTAVFLFREFVPLLSPAAQSDLYINLTAIAAAIPLMLSKDSLSGAVGKGRISRLIFVEAFGLKEEDFDIEPKNYSRLGSLAIFLGMILGLGSLFLSPLYLPMCIGALVLSAAILLTPEVGIIVAVFAMPFVSLAKYPSLIIALIVAVSAVGFIIKLIRGKRVFKLELLDLAVALFAVVLLMGGAISTGGASSLETAILSAVLMLGYFLALNMLRTQKWLDRCVGALTGSAVITAVVGIAQYITGRAVSDWLDTSYFSDIDGRVTVFFDNPNILGAYLAIAFPFLLAKTARSKDGRGRWLGRLSILAVVICAVLTWSRSAWVAMIVTAIIFALINNRNTLKWLLLLAASLPVAAYVLPKSVLRRFMSIGDLADSSSYYRVYTWRGTLKAISDNLLGGVGYGGSAYAEIYPQYAYAGIEAAAHSHNLYLQILFDVGIFGFLIFAAMLFFFSQKNFEFFKRKGDRGIKLMASAAFCACLAAFVIGIFDYVFYNLRIFFIFWIAMALSCAYIRFGDRERERQAERYASSPDSAFIDIDMNIRKGGFKK